MAEGKRKAPPKNWSDIQPGDLDDIEWQIDDGSGPVEAKEERRDEAQEEDGGFQEEAEEQEQEAQAGPSGTAQDNYEEDDPPPLPPPPRPKKAILPPISSGPTSHPPGLPASKPPGGSGSGPSVLDLLNDGADIAPPASPRLSRAVLDNILPLLRPGPSQFAPKSPSKRKQQQGSSDDGEPTKVFGPSPRHKSPEKTDPPAVDDDDVEYRVYTECRHNRTAEILQDEVGYIPMVVPGRKIKVPTKLKVTFKAGDGVGNSVDNDATIGGGTPTSQPQQPAQQSGGLFQLGAPPKPAGAQPAAGGLFGGAAASSQPASGGLFGAAPAASKPGGLFGGTATSQPAAGGLFGSPAPASSAPAAGGLFGAQPAAASSAPAAGGLFGGSTAASSAPPTGGLFGGAAQSSAPASGGLFGATAQSSQPAAGGLFGAAPAASKPGGLFGASTTPAQPAQPSGGLFGGSMASSQPAAGGSGFSLFNKPAPGSVPAQQPANSGLFGALNNANTSANAQQQTVPAVKIDLTNIKPTTRFSELHDDIQQSIMQIDRIIQDSIRASMQCSEALPVLGQSIEGLPTDVDYLGQRLETVEGALGRDALAVAQNKQVVEKDNEEAVMLFRGVENLKLPNQFHYSTIGSSNFAGTDDTENITDLLSFFSKRATELEAQAKQFEKYQKEVELHLRTVEQGAVEGMQKLQRRRDIASSGGGDKGKATGEGLREVAQVINTMEGAILRVAEKVGSNRDKVVDLSLRNGL